MSFDLDKKEFYETFAELQESEGNQRALEWAWSAIEWAQQELLREEQVATTEIQKSDIKEFLWLQNCIEEILFRETLQRAIAKGHYKPDQRWLYKERVTHCLDEAGGPEIWVQYEALIGRRTFAEVFTLREALSLCLFPQVIGKSISIEGDEE